MLKSVSNVSNIFYFHPHFWGRWTHFDEYFWDGLKPPTSLQLGVPEMVLGLGKQQWHLRLETREPGMQHVTLAAGARSISRSVCLLGWVGWEFVRVNSQECLRPPGLFYPADWRLCEHCRWISQDPGARRWKWARDQVPTEHHETGKLPCHHDWMASDGFKDRFRWTMDSQLHIKSRINGKSLQSSS